MRQGDKLFKLCAVGIVIAADDMVYHGIYGGNFPNGQIGHGGIPEFSRFQTTFKVCGKD